MTRISLVVTTALLVGTAGAQGTGAAFAQGTPGNTAPGATSNAPMPGVSPNTGVTPGTGVVNRNAGTAAASGDRNQAVATTNSNAPQPARGANSFSQGEARRRLERSGFQGVGALHKDDGGVWRGSATRDGQPVQVWLDYKGNSGQQSGMAQTMSAPGNPAGATGGRVVDPAPGTNAVGAGRAMDRTLGTNTTGTNPAGTAATAPR